MLGKYAYCRYFLIGSIVGIIAILGREIIGRMLPADTPVYYLFSVIIVYEGGMVASFYGHYRITFTHIKYKRANLVSMGRFVLIALAGMCITSLFSYLIRYYLHLEPVLGGLLPSFGFAVATLVASVFTFTLNARYTYRGYNCQIGSGKQRVATHENCCKIEI